MHVLSSMTARASPIEYASFAGKIGARGGENAQANAERQLREREAAQQKLEDMRAQARIKVRAGQPGAILGVSDYGYTGDLNGGQVSLILLDSYKRQMAVQSMWSETVRKAEEDKTTDQLQEQDQADTNGTANDAATVKDDPTVAGQAPEDTSSKADVPKADRIQAALQLYQKQASADTTRDGRELLIA